MCQINIYEVGTSDHTAGTLRTSCADSSPVREPEQFTIRLKGVNEGGPLLVSCFYGSQINHPVLLIKQV